MVKSLEEFSVAQKMFAGINELPGYFINGIGVICYKNKNEQFQCCKNTEYHNKQKLPGSGWVHVFVDGKLTVRNSFIYADKYFPEWYLYRSQKVCTEYNQFQKFLRKNPIIIQKHK